MASPPTPGSFPAGDLISWGPLLEGGEQLRAGPIVDLVRPHLELSETASVAKLLGLKNQHRYVLVDRIAASGNSTVCVAIDRVLVREVAVKVHRGRDPRIDDRVIAEARAMSRIDHPNAVRIFDFGQADGQLYSVTELCDADMQAWSGAREWREVVERIIEAGRGLARLHAEGLVHGDIKPSNILIKNGAAKIADFGLASGPGWSAKVVGTPGYIAPEVARGFRSTSGDVFGLAASAWACLFGVPPFGLPPVGVDGEGAIAVLVERALAGEFAAPSRKPVGLPKSLPKLIRAGLEPEPAARPPLDVWLAGLRGVLESAERSGRRRRRLPWLLGAVVGAGALLGVVSYAVAVRSPAATLRVVQEPTDYATQAEAAAVAGEANKAVRVLHDGYSRFSELSPREQADLVESAERVVALLKAAGFYDDANLAEGIAEILRRRAAERKVEAEGLSSPRSP